MKTLKLTAAATLAAVLAGPVLAQAVVPPAAAPEAVAAFTPPEGYAVLDDWAGLTADQVTGSDIAGPDGAVIGTVSDIRLGADPASSGIVADIGGFLGMGVHTVLLGADQVSLYRNADGNIILYSALTKEQLEALPEYTPPG